MTQSQCNRYRAEQEVGPTPPIAPVVVGVDGSKFSASALVWACEYAQANAREVLAVCVRDLNPLPDDLIIGASPWDELADADDPDMPVRSMLDEMVGAGRSRLSDGNHSSPGSARSCCTRAHPSHRDHRPDRRGRVRTRSIHRHADGLSEPAPGLAQSLQRRHRAMRCVPTMTARSITASRLSLTLRRRIGHAVVGHSGPRHRSIRRERSPAIAPSSSCDGEGDELS